MNFFKPSCPQVYRILAVAAIVAFAQSISLAEDVANWKGVQAKTTDLMVDAGGPGYRSIGFASSMTSNGCHVAKVEGFDGEGMWVRLDGKPGKRYNRISQVLFSADGTALAYVARQGREELVVLNDMEGPPFDFVCPETLVLSEREHHVVYLAQSGPKLRVVVDGKPQDNGIQPYRSAPVLNGEGSRWAFAGNHPVSRKSRFVTAGDPALFHDGVDPSSFCFSPNGRWCYAAQDGHSWRRVINGVKQASFDAVGIDFIFSPDGKHYAYTGRRGPESFLVMEGKEERGIAGMVDHTLVFSADSRRLALAVANPDKSCYILLDGEAGPACEGIGGNQASANPWTASTFSLLGFGLAYPFIGFSPDSQCFAYFARQNGTWKLWLNGKPLPVLMDKPLQGLLFSKDSKRLAYGGTRGGKAFLVVDGQKGEDYDELGHFEFSADAKHVAFQATKGPRCVLVVDGIERATYASVPAGPVFRTDGALEWIAVAEKTLQRTVISGF